jgi:hypothetical protein
MVPNLGHSFILFPFCLIRTSELAASTNHIFPYSLACTRSNGGDQFSGTFSTINVTWIDLGSNMSHHDNRPATKPEPLQTLNPP